MHIRGFAIAVLVIATAACTDAGTRVAYDLESEPRGSEPQRARA